ncbi:MAG TPA: hypothetical protein VHP38_11045 [Ruminiclostridium sp.]|nr:hypothetical protein [Ruminiclostridium sp.]
MKDADKQKLTRMIHIAGVVALILGAVDPMEGSVVIAGGSVLLAIWAYLANDKYKGLFLTGMVLILTGVFFLFYFSARGGIGGSSSYSWKWGLLMIPYPLGWLMDAIVLIIRGLIRRRQ